MRYNKQMLLDKEMRALIRKHEGVSQFPYVDTVVKITIGVGRNLSDRGLEPAEINFLFEQDINIALITAKSFLSNFSELHHNCQVAIVSMAFNLGSNKLATFKKQKQALISLDYKEAALQAMDSKWAKQVGNRAIEIARLLEDKTLSQ